MYSIKKYDRSHYALWNDLVQKSKNGTFLFHRDFMEYHADRFEDYSLIVFDNDKPVALLPANRVGDILHSHQGLTYGGLLYTEKTKQAAVIAIIAELLAWLHGEGIKTLHVKTIPYIYHKMPAQEMDYALFLANGTLTRRDALSVIERTSALPVAANRMQGVKKGEANGFMVTESDDFESFWNTLLLPVLKKKHGAKPVHTLEEIQLLKSRFPDNIRLFMVERYGLPTAGTVLFETDTVVHAQYIAAADDKNETGSLDFLYHHLITETFAQKKYFDFGISNEEQGRKLNGGLAFWKESYGARTVVQDFYKVRTSDFGLLDNVIL